MISAARDRIRLLWTTGPGGGQCVHPALLRRKGMTLVEMLVATAAAVIVMGVVAQVLGEFTRGIGNSRRLTELGGRLRTTAQLLRRDLAGATTPLLPPASPSAGVGYFEIIEGPRQDSDAADGSGELRADTDDVLLFTTRDVGRLFTGACEGGVVHAGAAEVAWFLRPTVPATNPPSCTLYRRQLLVVGRLDDKRLDRIRQVWQGGGLPAVYDLFDISLASDAGDPAGLTPNTLSDLTRRERRFFHGPLDPAVAGVFPFPFLGDHQVASVSSASEQLPASARGLIFDALSPRRGEDVLLTNVIAFDVRMFDPAAAIDGSGPTPLSPGDAVALTGGVANGAYVDLGNGVNARAVSLPDDQNPRFAGLGHPLSGLVGGSTTRRTYDTWSTHYEANGIDEDGVAGADQGTNGLDDAVPARADGPVAAQDADGVADDSGELETAPPYPFPLRGIEVRIRCYEPESRQVRQVTVRHAFVLQ